MGTFLLSGRWGHFYWGLTGEGDADQEASRREIAGRRAKFGGNRAEILSIVKIAGTFSVF